MTDRVPTYVDADRLCFELCVSIDTIERMIAAGKFPRPKPGMPGKRLWKWSEVQATIDGKGKSAATSREIGQEIRDYARAAAQGVHR